MIVACARIRLTRRNDAPTRLGTAIFYVLGRYGGLFEGATEALCNSITIAFDQTSS